MNEVCQIAIIGSGFSGLGMAIRLKQIGIDDFQILERKSDVGGVWRDANYPGCACDVQSQLYSFSFAPNPNWSRKYSPQKEILDYLKRCAEDFRITAHIRLNCELMRADWDGSHWKIITSQGPLRARILISGTGAFGEPALPDIPGIQDYRGAIYHSAAWNHGYDLSGKEVAIVGTGASSIQFVPQVQKQVKHLTLFQRSAPWIMPRMDKPVSEKQRWCYRKFPLFMKLRRLSLYWVRECFAIAFRKPFLQRLGKAVARRHLSKQVKDAELRRKLTPHYSFGCKRVLVSDDYYPALTQPNVTVECEPIICFTKEGIKLRGEDKPRPFDAILLGTGYRVSDFPIADRIFDRAGRTLNEHWGGSPRAYLGTAVPSFPNFFTLLGPNTGLGHSSVVLMIEAQIEWVLKALQYARKEGFATIAPTRTAFESFQNEVDQFSERTVWVKGGCQSWYLDRNGRNSTLWPMSIVAFRKRLRFHPMDCEFLPLNRSR